MRKILIISSCPTHPTNAGNRMCILSYANLLREMGYDVYFLLIASRVYYPKERYNETSLYWENKFFLYRINIFSRLLFYLHKIFFKFSIYNKLDSLYPWGIARYLQRLQKNMQFDSIIVNYVFLSRIFNCLTAVKKILYTHDVFTNKCQRTGSKGFSLSPNDEAKGLNRADIILSIQKNETIYYRFLTQKKVFTVYSYFPIKQTPLIGEKSILYLSSSNLYNIESVRFFIEEIYPELEKLYPTITFIVGGLICDEIKHLVANKNNIILQGHVSDVTQFYNQADICINPTFNGTGLKIKTFEALSFGKILVAHPHSVIGIYKKEKAPIFLAENKEEYIKQFQYLFENVDLWEKMKNDSVDYMISFGNHIKQQWRSVLM